LKVINGKKLILTSVLLLCIFLPFEYFRRNSSDTSLSLKIANLENGIREVENRAFAADEIFLEKIESTAEKDRLDPSKQMFAGTCFFEIHEIDGFLLKKLQGEDELLKVYPPLGLTLTNVGDGVKLAWSPNPQNESLIQKLAGNPLLRLSCKIYRWTSEGVAQPEVIKSVPYSHNSFIDVKISPASNRYFYSVLLAYEGVVEQQRTLIESERSEVKSIVSNDRFELEITGGDTDKVEIKVSIRKKGAPHSRIFSVTKGGQIGGLVEISGGNPMDFSTFLTVTAIKTSEEKKEVQVPHPAFNSNGSRSLDTITNEPVFRNLKEIRTIEKLYIECEDLAGNRRTVKES